MTHIIQHPASRGTTEAPTPTVASANQDDTGKRPCRPWCVSHIVTAGDGEICQGETIRLDFRTPNRTAGHVSGVSLGLSYSDDEGDNAFVEFSETGPAYMSVDDLRELLSAAAKLIVPAPAPHLTLVPGGVR